MIEQLQAVRARYDEINCLLQDPTVIQDNARYAKLMKEYKNLTPIAQTYDAYRASCNAMQQAKEILEEGGDEELKALAQDELKENKARAEALEEELKILLLPKDENDERSVIMEIRGGAGGEEAALFAHSLQRMYTMYAESRGWRVEVLNINETELGTTVSWVPSSWLLPSCTIPAPSPLSAPSTATAAGVRAASIASAKNQVIRRFPMVFFMQIPSCTERAGRICPPVMHCYSGR